MSDASLRGRVLANVIRRFTKDRLIGHKFRTGEFRKKFKEPEWKVPDIFQFTHIDMNNFSMKLLERKEHPNRDCAVLQLHGGGYLVGVHNAYYVTAGLYNELSRGAAVLTPDYRVAPEHPFPAALEDAVEAYRWLLQKGYRGSQIIVAGDSAGGGLTLALSMYLRDHDMELPAGLVLMSPWTDVTASGESYESNYTRDPLFGNTRESMIFENAYPGELDTKNPYISPLFGDFRGLPPMLFQVGSEEMLLSDSVDAAAKAREAGVKVRLTVYDGMFHNFQMAHMRIPESRDAWGEVRRFFFAVLQQK